MEKTAYHGASGLILFTKHYYGNDIKENGMLGHMARMGEKCIQDSGVETQTGHLEDLHTDGRILWIIQNENGRRWN
jgi:hypothetical protein